MARDSGEKPGEGEGGKRRIRLGGVMLVVALLGVFDAGYLSYKHYTHTPLNCPRALFGLPIDNCGSVTGSAYATIAGIPVALLGAGYYTLVALLVLAFLLLQREHWLRLASYLTFIGILASAWFVSVQIIILGAICLYCMFSALTSTTLFVLGGVALFSLRQVEKKKVPSGGITAPDGTAQKMRGQNA